MSADNWTTCPRCTRRREAEIESAEEKIALAYGKVPLDEWEEMRRRQSDLITRKPDRTLREDYEFHGASDGEVVADYSASCDTCDLRVSFTHQHQIEGLAQ
ncbi:hypothetical protein [Brachybacterium paraconglomeratum]|uniref:hypothetical protein n=1 Tax=Brachybacterium paraconglomeratum TaxID=173362 RepID=UPI00026C68EE|nr:hypothetical protein [Brachybacterium paraconglomeratum]